MDNKNIKEILDFKEDADYKRISVDEIVILKDYITNLQEENERLKIEKQEEYNRFNLMAKFRDRALERTLIYKSRNEKAIKMFNIKTLNKYYYGNSYEFAIKDFKKDVLNILQGEDKDDK